MEKLDISKIGKLKPNPIFKGLPKKLKDPSNFADIEKQLAIVLASDHKHKTVKSYVTCAWCNERREQRHKLMKKIGFKSIAQYLEWKKIHEIIRDKKNFQVK